MSDEKYGIVIHMNRFNSEEKCKEYLRDKRWEEGVTCPNCGNKHMNYYLAKRDVYKCPNCKKQFSLLKGTIFEGTKLTLMTWFQAIFFVTTFKRGVSSCQLAKILGVQQKTAWFMLHRIREAMKNENDRMLSGVVEVDETAYGPKISQDKRLQARRKKHNDEQNRIFGYSKVMRKSLGLQKARGRKKGSTKEVLAAKKIAQANAPKRRTFGHEMWILGMLERGGPLVLEVLGNQPGNRGVKSIMPKLLEHIDVESTIVTDQWTVYENNVPKHFSLHQSVNHEKGYVINGISTNGIENVWMHLKKFLRGTFFHVAQHYLHRYLSEFQFRWNRMHLNEKALFEDFFDSIGERITKSTLQTLKIAA